MSDPDAAGDGTPIPMTQLLAAMQTDILAVAIPLFDRNVDRFVVYVLILRQTLRGGAGTPVLAVANSLALPFETTRRHVNALIRQDLCARLASGIVATDRWRDDQSIRALAELSHDVFVRFVEDLRAVAALPQEGRTVSYDWRDGLQAAIDLMLSVTDTNQEAHRDWVDLVLFSTILHANFRAGAAPVPVRVSAIARLLSLAPTTVQRRISQMVAAGRLTSDASGVAISTAWMATDHARATTAATYANVRRIVAALEAKGFPFEAPARAYRTQRPMTRTLD